MSVGGAKDGMPVAALAVAPSDGRTVARLEDIFADFEPGVVLVPVGMAESQGL